MATHNSGSFLSTHLPAESSDFRPMETLKKSGVFLDCPFSRGASTMKDEQMDKRTDGDTDKRPPHTAIREADSSSRGSGRTERGHQQLSCIELPLGVRAVLGHSV